MSYVSVLASASLDGKEVEDYYSRRGDTMKIKTTFYSRSKGKDFDPLIHVKYPKNRADQVSFTPTAKLVDQMFRTGQMVLASKAQYDFPDGKDDGRSVPLDRVRGLDLPEISQAMQENEAKLKEHDENIKKLAKDAKKNKAEPKDNTAQGSSDVGSVANDGANT